MSDLVSKNKTFPQQSSIYINPYKAEEEKPQRYHKEIGLGFKTPATAINGDYVDKKCPFTGDVSIRGRIIKGEVIKMKQEKTIVVMKRYFHYNSKYKRYERRNTKFNVHLSPCFFGLVNIGDTVTCGEVRPISKTKRFVVIENEKKKFKEGKVKMISEI